MNEIFPERTSLCQAPSSVLTSYSSSSTDAHPWADFQQQIRVLFMCDLDYMESHSVCSFISNSAQVSFAYHIMNVFKVHRDHWLLVFSWTCGTSPQPILEHFHHPEKKWRTLSRPLPSSCPRTRLLDVCYEGNSRRHGLCVCLLLLSTVLSRFIHVGPRVSFLSMTGWRSFVQLSTFHHPVTSQEALGLYTLFGYSE